VSKMLEELAEVVRLDRRERYHAAGYGLYLEPDAPYAALTFLQTHHATITDMAKRLEAAERDAARLNFVEQHPDWMNVMRFKRKHLWRIGPFSNYPQAAFPTLREAIDAAMQESGE